MTRLLAPTIAACLAASAALAQVRVEVALPTITFQAPPPLVVVQPGIQVVEDHDEEVFFVDRMYWLRRGGRWYRSPDHRGHWVLVERGVPPGLARLPPGRYRHWRAAEHREERKEERREEKREERGKGHGKDKH